MIAQPQPPEPFFHLTLENILTWVIIALAWYTSYVRQAQLFRDSLEGIKKWIDKHEKEAEERDKLISQLEKATVALTTLAEVAEKRLQRMEDIHLRTRDEAELT